MTKLERRPLSPSSAWLAAFLPALSYFIATRSNMTHLWGRSASLGVATVVDIDGDCSQLRDVFFTECTESGTRLKHPLYLVQKEGLKGVVSTIWRHDSELGRGYLLLSQNNENGRIWRWEVGGGPIPIGKTLHMDPSGCRSNHYLSCGRGSGNAGSAGLAVDFLDQEQAAEGRLVVVELGEGRIVRMEESGARTPLIVQIPSLCKDDDSPKRLQQPGQLFFSPFGDLLFTDNQEDCGGGILRLRNAMHIKPIASLTASREAHFWNSTLNHDEHVEVIFQDGIDRICGVALDKTWTGIFAAVVRDQSFQLLYLPLGNTDDADGDGEGDEQSASKDSTVEKTKSRILDGTARVLHNFGKYPHNLYENVQTGALAVDRLGRIFVTVHDGVHVLDRQGNMLGSIPMHKPPTSLTLGEDGFLYVSTRNELFRMKVKAGPFKVPTNLVLKSSSYSSS